MSKIGRAAHHGNTFAMRFNMLAKFYPVAFILHFNEPRIPFESIYIQLRRHFYPFRNRERSILTKRLHKCFGKSGKFRHQKNLFYCRIFFCWITADKRMLFHIQHLPTEWSAFISKEINSGGGNLRWSEYA